MKILKYLTLFCLLEITFLITQVSAIQQNNINDLFNKANKLYNEKKYIQAVDIYRTIESLGISNGDVYYNIGNSYLKINDLGFAKLYYLKAQKYIPRDQDLINNLIRVNEKLNDKVDLSFWDKLNSINNKISLQEMTTLFFTFWTITWILIFLMFFLNNNKNTSNKEFKPFVKISLRVFFVISSLLSLSYLTHFYSLKDKKALIITQEAEIKTAKDVDSVSLFKLEQGNILKIISISQKWSKVEFDNKLGWIQNSSIEQI